MSKAIAEIAIGVGMVALDIFAPEIGIALTPWMSSMLIGAGSALVMGGIGTLLTKQQQGLGANTMNPIEPWNVVYGQAKIGGTCIYLEETGQSDKYLHMIYALACHPCNSIDYVVFDNKRVCLDTSGNSISFGDSTVVIGTQQTVNIAKITRQNDVVTVIMTGPMTLPASTAAGPPLLTGDTVQIQNVSGDNTLNGQFVIQVLNSTTFTYVSGGNPISLTGEGSVLTQWPDYGDTIHVEYATGWQGPGLPPFPGLLASGDTGSNGVWTANCLLQGRTAVYLRLKYGGNTYASGIPNIGFVVSGKNDIYDPRTGTRGFTANSALCIADYLTNQVWGFKLNYGTDVPTAPLIAAANICDEQVPLATGGFEYRYACDGSFQLSAHRGEILQNLLTSCGGRITYSGGIYVINPAAWIGATVQAGNATPTNAAGSPIVSAVLTVVASFTQGSSGIGLPVIGGVFGQFGTSPSLLTFQANVGSLVQDFSFYMNGIPTVQTPSPTTLNYQISTAQLSLIPQLQVVLGIEGTLFGNDSSPVATFIIWQVYLTATFADGTNSIVRPAGVNAVQQGADGQVTNPNDAADSDPSTFTTINRSSYGGVASLGFLQLSGFAFSTTNNVLATPLTLQYAGGPFQWKPKLPIRDLYNGVKATYVCPANSWQPSDMPPYAQDTDHGYSAPSGVTGYYDYNVAADGGDRRWFDMQFPFTISTATAQRLAKIELLRRRQQGMGTFAFNLAMYQLTALDIVSMTLPYFGWTNKLLEVTAHRFTVQKHDEQNRIALGTELDLQETDPSVYEWSTTEELSAEGYQQPSMIGTQTIAAPIGIALTSGAGVATVGSNGVSTSRVQITWPLPTDGFITNGGYTLAQYSLDNTNWIGVGQFDSSVTTAYIPQVTDGQQYWARLAFVNVAGVQSPWTVQGPITASGSSLAYHRVDDEIPSGAIDGVNVTFTLSQTPSPAASLELYLNGLLEIQTVDYTLSGNTITITSYIPNVSDSLRAWYWY